MITLDKGTREFNILKSLVNMVVEKETKLLPEFFNSYDAPNFEKPVIYVDKDADTVFIYVPNAVKNIGVGDTKRTIETEAIIIYDLKADNDNGESFNKTLQKYNIDYLDAHWYGSFEEAVLMAKESKSFLGWVPPVRPDYLDAAGMKQASQGALDDFLNEMEDGVEDGNEEAFCPYCGNELGEDGECIFCNESGEENFCTGCGTELTEDGECPKCDGIEEPDEEEGREDIDPDGDEDERNDD